MRFAGAGRTEQMKHFRAVDELELGQGQDPVAVERRLEREVEALEGLDRSQACGVQGHLSNTFDTPGR